ncbi:oligosaccharide flippase family protein [Patescibacteria group bacterium]|nr:oligosaccharide flippase family protein [Patescibacteria group bacterium]
MLKKILNKIPTSQKFNIDVSWNILSFVIMGIIGILLNIIIAKFYNTSVLGVFNQVYAFFIFFSQLSVAGIHLSVLKNVSQFHTDYNKKNIIFSSSLYLTIIISFLISISVFWLKDFIGILLNSPSVSIGIYYGLPGLFFLAINKIYLSFYNACRKMKFYASINIIRFCLLLLSLILFIYLKIDVNKLPVIFSLAEGITFVILFIYSIKFIKYSFSKKIIQWIIKHIKFGVKGLLGHALLDLNTRTDIIMLGFFVSDSTVGIYSLAAILAEGFDQLTAAFKININPLLARYKFKKTKQALKSLISSGRNLTYKIMFPIGVLSIFLFPLMLSLLKIKTEFSKAWPIFSILILFQIICVGYAPFRMLLTQTGFPGYQTFFVSLFFISNIILNLILIPVFGMYGAAIATGTSFILGILYLKIFTWKKLKIKI